MKTGSKEHLGPTRWKAIGIAVCVGAVGVLGDTLQSRRVRKADSRVPAQAAPRTGEPAFPELVEDESATLRADRATRRRTDEERLHHASPPAPQAPVHDDELVHYLGTFLGGEPDILGWNACLGMLARNAELDRDSLREDEEGLHGSFTIAGTDVRVDFTVDGEGYTILATSGATLRLLGKRSTASLSFQATRSGISRAYGSVQFFPPLDQPHDDDAPVGYIYGTTTSTTLFRPIQELRGEGTHAVRLAPPSANRRLEAGDLEPAHEWLDLLQEAERSHARRGS